MKTYNHVADNAAERQILATFDQNPSTPIVHATNTEMASPVASLMVMAFGFAAFTLALSFAFWVQDYIGWWGGSIIGLLAFVGAFVFLVTKFFPYISGDAAALRESDNRRKVDEANVEARRDAFLAMADARVAESNNWREVEIAKTVAQAEKQAITEKVARLEKALQLSGDYGQRQIAVDPTAREMSDAIYNYLEHVYTNSDIEVTKDNRLTGKLPWNDEWKGKPWKDEAKRKMTEGDARVLEWDAGWLLIWDDLQDALSVIGRF